jgi:glycosyltransferase involved in cell wall biosynthesis
MTKAQILVPSVRVGDAVGEHTFQLCRVLRQRYDQTSILINYAPGPLPPDMTETVRRVKPQHLEQADLTIVQYPLWFPLAERVRDMAGARVFWYHGVTPPDLWGSQRDVELLRDSQIRTALAWHAHLVVADSPFTAQELHQSSDFPLDRIRIAPLGIDTSRFSAAPDASELARIRQKWALEGRQVLLFVGRIAGNKRIDLLIDALARLRDRRPAIKLLVIGDNQYNDAAQEIFPALSQQVEALDLGDQVVFTGRVDSIIPYLHVADIFLLPSQHEGFGVPLVEAMAAGAPVIASASGAMPWVLAAENDGQGEPAGLLFAPGDVDDLVRQIAHLLDDPELAQRLVARGRIRARDFGPDIFTRNALAVVDEAITLSNEPTLFDAMLGQTLYPQADIAIHDYRVRSNAPLVGPLIEWTRTQMTSHLKEPYIDKIMARQVRYNQMLASELDYLHAQMRQIEARIEALRGERGDDE